MKHITTFIISCISVSPWVNLHSQNLAPNPNFETYSTCPTSVAQLPYATGWMNVAGHGGSADYMNVCSTSGLVDVPGNAFGTQAANSGNGYIGFAMYYQSTPNFREYIQCPLSSPLVAGQTYTIQFYASLSDNSQFSAPCFQFYFSNAALTWGGGGWGPITSVTPQVTSTVHITSKTVWTLFTATYTAAGGEQYMTMGNYRNDASTPGITAAGAGSYSTVYYYIDDFTITPGSPLPVDLSFFQVECTDYGTVIKWTTSSEINNDYFTIESSEDGVNYTTEFIVDGQGNSNHEQTYSYTTSLRGNPDLYIRLSQTDFNGQVHTFSPKSVSCKEDLTTTCPVVNLSNAQTDVEIYSTHDEDIEMDVFDASGVSKLHQTFQTHEGSNILSMNTANLPKGIYFIQVNGASRQCTAKFLKSN